jgi:3-oxoacyl-[acyl-carrier protein] reductase
VTEQRDLQGLKALVTGATAGLGRAIAMQLAREGAEVFVHGRDAARGAQTIEAIRAEGGRARFVAADLSKPADIKRLAHETGDVDILVNNAGDIPGGTLESVDEEKWRHAWELKVFSYVNLTRQLYAHMQARRSGVIVNVIGMAAERPTFEYICGSTANAGLAAFTKALGKGQHGVRVLGVHPPATRTERIVAVMKDAAKAKFGDESRYQELAGDGAFAGMMEPEQVADVVTFLASPRCAQISGVVVNLGP